MFERLENICCDNTFQENQKIRKGSLVNWGSVNVG